VTTGQAVESARVGQHVAHPAEIAIGAGALDQRLDIAAVDRERSVEPGNRGRKPVLAAGQDSAKHQRFGVARAGGDSAVGRFERAGDVAIGASEAGDVGPDSAVVRREGEGAIEGDAPIGAVAQLEIGATADSRCIGLVGAIGTGRCGERGSGIALEQFGMGEEMRGLASGDASLARAHDLRFRGDAVAEREIDARLHHPRRLVAGIGLERVEQLDMGGAHIAQAEGGDSALIGRALAARASREQRQSEQRRAGPHACSPYCFSRS
jgi:hypothetical protein